jgi:TonB family protein
LQHWPSGAGWGVVLLSLAFLAIALLIDAGGPGVEHGLAEAYPRRLGLLVAYAVLVPLALLALRRVAGDRDALRDGLALATALTGLMWLAWRPGLLLLAPPMQSSSAFESAVPAPPEADAVGAPPLPPPPPPPKVVVAQSLSGSEFVEVGGVEGGIDGGIEGGVVGGPAAGVIGATLSPAPPPPTTERIVQPDVLKGLRISGADVIPPPHLHAHAHRVVVAVALHVNAGGTVTGVELMRSSGNRELDDYVISGVQSWHFRPWTEQGRAVPIQSGITFVFVNRP